MREARPQRFVFVQADDRHRRMRRRIVGHQHVLAIAQVHAFDRARRGDDRFARAPCSG
jgi:hypothetical protein